MKKKASLTITILLLAIGFAAVSTTLIINGNATVSENTDDFSVMFTSASLDGQDVYANVISEDKKTITFETKELKTLNQTSMLNYEVTNNSANYDAEVSVNCKVKENTTAKYTSIKNELENNATIVRTKESVNGTLTVTLDKTATEEVKEEYVCTLEFNAVERNELGTYTGPTEWTFDYTGGEQTFVAPVTGVYKLETWGAQGGNGNKSESYYGGYGSYSIGEVYLTLNKKVYLNIGGQGQSACVQSICSGGYNGGSASGAFMSDRQNWNSGGGGATHMAFSSGLLSTFKDKVDNLLIVSGGGGGAMNRTSDGIKGGSAGCIKGNRSINSGSCSYYGTGGSQDTGGTTYLNDEIYSNAIDGKFGLGGTYLNIAENYNSSGGGAGYYGGAFAGGGGSGYIGNQLLTDKSMYCYNCQESTEESTKTISTTCVSETPTENCAKSGNGYARITLIK